MRLVSEIRQAQLPWLQKGYRYKSLALRLHPDTLKDIKAEVAAPILYSPNSRNPFEYFLGMRIIEDEQVDRFVIEESGGNC